jgi:hypothetical protein
VAITNWVGKVAIRSNVVQLNPFQLNLNGGPVSVTGNVNVGWPGYLYDVAFKADSVPLAPLANSFGSGKTNSLVGNLIADAQIRGAGTTGPNLRKNLAGNANINLTNLNYEVAGPKLKRILVPISVALNLPEIAQSPINWASVQTDAAGNGQVNLKHLGVESTAFYAESAGAITLNDIITNSVLSLPVDLSVPRSLAEKARFASGDSSTNKYVKLPRFVSIEGTLGSPEAKINKLAIAGMIARGAAAFNLGGAKAQGALGAVGNLLTGQTGGTNNASTNTTANLVQGLGSLLGAKTATNNPSATATNSTRDNLATALGGLLNSQTTATNGTKGATENAATNAVQNALDSLLRPKPKKK